MKIRWKLEEKGRWTRWVDVDKTRKFLPEEAFIFEISESLAKTDAMVLLPGMFASLRADYKMGQKRDKKKLDKIKEQLNEDKSVR